MLKKLVIGTGAAALLGSLIFGRDGSDYLVVASKGGAPDHPGWYKNLTAHPDIEIQVKGDVLPVRARTCGQSPTRARTNAPRERPQ